jgi:hypothetical protein
MSMTPGYSASFALSRSAASASASMSADCSRRLIGSPAEKIADRNTS